MRTNDGVEIKNGSNVWIAYQDIINSNFKPIKVNMYDQKAHFKYWYHERKNCQSECDKLNGTTNQQLNK